MTVQVDNSERRFEIEGRDLGYPTFFRDGSSMMGLFLVPASRADELIAESGFRVAEVAPGRAVLSLNCVHYTDTDCGEYEEMALAFFVRRKGDTGGLRYVSTWRDIVRGDVASYTWRLPVTTKLARDAGIFMWGFPKTIEDLTYEAADDTAKMTWLSDGKKVLSYSVSAKGSRTPARISPPVYSVFEGGPHVSHLTQRYRDVGYRPGGGTLVLGDHPIADELRTLGLPRRPLMSTWNGHLSFEMSAPQEL